MPLIERGDVPGLIGHGVGRTAGILDAAHVIEALQREGGRFDTLHDEPRDEAGAVRAQHAGDLPEVVRSFVGQQVREDRRGDHEIEAAVIARKAVLGGLRAGEVVGSVVEVGMDEVEFPMMEPFSTHTDCSSGYIEA